MEESVKRGSTTSQKIRTTIPNRLLDEYETVKRSYPKLEDPIIEDSNVIIFGSISIIDENKKNWGDFNIKIQIPQEYPDILPKVFDTEERIPRIPDRHINHDGSCCLGPRLKLYHQLNNEITIQNWLDKLAIPFFANQLYYELEDHFFSGEYSHGAKGILEYYKEYWNSTDIDEIKLKLKRICGIGVGRNEKCFCGSDVKYKKCHLWKREFEGIPINIYKLDLDDLR